MNSGNYLLFIFGTYILCLIIKCIFFNEYDLLGTNYY